MHRSRRYRPRIGNLEARIISTRWIERQGHRFPFAETKTAASEITPTALSTIGAHQLVGFREAQKVVLERPPEPHPGRHVSDDCRRYLVLGARPPIYRRMQSTDRHLGQIGRAQWRDRVCQYV